MIFLIMLFQKTMKPINQCSCPFLRNTFKKCVLNKDGFFLFWNLEYVMDNAISSNELLIKSSKLKRTVSNEEVPIYYLGIAYVGNENFFKLSNLKEEFPVSTFEEANVDGDKMKEFHHRSFLSSFIDFLDTNFPTEEGSICLDEGHAAEEGSSSQKAFFHYANDQHGRGHLLKSISKSYMVGIFVDDVFDSANSSSFGFVSGCVWKPCDIGNPIDSSGELVIQYICTNRFYGSNRKYGKVKFDGKGMASYLILLSSKLCTMKFKNEWDITVPFSQPYLLCLDEIWTWYASIGFTCLRTNWGLTHDGIGSIDELLPKNVLDAYGNEKYVIPEFYLMKMNKTELKAYSKTGPNHHFNELMKNIKKDPTNKQWILPLIQFYSTFFNLTEVDTKDTTIMKENYGTLKEPEGKYFHQRALMSVITKEGHQKLKTFMKERHVWDCLNKCWFVDENIKDLYTNPSYKSFKTTYQEFASHYIAQVLDYNHWFYEGKLWNIERTQRLSLIHI